MKPMQFLQRRRGGLVVGAILAAMIGGPALGQPAPEGGSEPAESYAAELAAYEAQMEVVRAARRAWNEQFKRVKPAYDREWEAANERLKRTLATAPSAAERRRLEDEFYDVTVPELRRRHIFALIGEQPYPEDPPRPQPQVAASQPPPAHLSAPAVPPPSARASPDPSEIFELRGLDAYRVLGVHHVGVCETQPTLLIEQMDLGSHSRMAPPARDLPAYVVYAREVAELYARQCPEVSSVRFAISPMPINMECEGKQECFLEVPVPVPSHRGFNSSAEFVRQVRIQPVTTFDDMTEVLAAGRFDIVATVEGFFNHYLGEYFIAYSNHCSAHIQKPVRRTLQSDQHHHDPIENRMVVVEGSPKILSIEAEHVTEFDRRYEAGFRWAAAFAFSVMASQPMNAVSGAAWMSNWSIDNVLQMKSFVSQACTSDRLLTVQHNLLAYSRGEPPLTGKYFTNKEPLPPRVVQPNSAPRFVEAYEREREEFSAILADRRRDKRVARLEGAVSFAAINDLNELDRAFALAGQTVLLDLYAEIAELEKAGRHAEVEALQQRSAQRGQQIQEAWQQRRAELTRGGRR